MEVLVYNQLDPRQVSWKSNMAVDKPSMAKLSRKKSAVSELANCKQHTESESTGLLSVPYILLRLLTFKLGNTQTQRREPLKLSMAL